MKSYINRKYNFSRFASLRDFFLSWHKVLKMPVYDVDIIILRHPGGACYFIVLSLPLAVPEIKLSGSHKHFFRSPPPPSSKTDDGCDKIALAVFPINLSQSPAAVAPQVFSSVRSTQCCFSPLSCAPPRIRAIFSISYRRSTLAGMWGAFGNYNRMN